MVVFADAWTVALSPSLSVISVSYIWVHWRDLRHPANCTAAIHGTHFGRCLASSTAPPLAWSRFPSVVLGHSASGPLRHHHNETALVLNQSQKKLVSSCY